MNKRHLTLKDRMELEALYNKGWRAEQIAAKLKVHRSTVYNELHRGDTGEMDCNGRIGYSAELAQRRLFCAYRNRRAGRPAAE
nr:helix-turn-helix domain-containing protein [Eubacteriales bacterium]